MSKKEVFKRKERKRRGDCFMKKNLVLVTSM
jgi:hypothetical protein